MNQENIDLKVVSAPKQDEAALMDRLNTIANVEAPELYGGQPEKDIVGALRGLATTALEGVASEVLKTHGAVREILREIAETGDDNDKGTWFGVDSPQPMLRNGVLTLEEPPEPAFATWRQQIEFAKERASDALDIFNHQHEVIPVNKVEQILKTVRDFTYDERMSSAINRNIGDLLLDAIQEHGTDKQKEAVEEYRRTNDSTRLIEISFQRVPGADVPDSEYVLFNAVRAIGRTVFSDDENLSRKDRVERSISIATQNLGDYNQAMARQAVDEDLSLEELEDIYEGIENAGIAEEEAKLRKEMQAESLTVVISVNPSPGEAPEEQRIVINTDRDFRQQLEDASYTVGKEPGRNGHLIFSMEADSFDKTIRPNLDTSQIVEWTTEPVTEAKFDPFWHRLMTDDQFAGERQDEETEGETPGYGYNV